MKKILWISEYHNPTGFARVTKALLPYLTDFHITVLDYQKTFPLTPMSECLSLMGTVDTQDLNGFRTFQAMDLSKFDLIYMLNDPWGVDMFLQIMQEKKCDVPVVAYFPVDAQEQDPSWYSRFDMVKAPVTYTRFAFNEAVKARADLDINLKVIPHGVDTEVFKRIDLPLDVVRKQAYGAKSNIQGTVFLNANRNQPRKRLDITLRAFAEMAEEKDDVWLHMHCGNTDTSIDVYKLAQRLGCHKKLILTGGPASHGWQKVSEAQLNLFYNAAQFGLNSCIGEGFGLTNVEHAAAGGIQIVPDHSACRELFHDIDNGIFLINSITPYTTDDIMTVGYIPEINSMSDLMTIAYFMDKEEMAELSIKSTQKFTSDQYLWKNIATQWRQIFNEL